MDDDLLQISEEVAAALQSGSAVVALESTLITHGLPYPDNVATAARMERVVRGNGAVPATIAVLHGRIHVGLSLDQLEYLGRLPPGRVRKCSRRDLPLVVARGEDGATTVAGTMIVARKAGIELFATGGIGGVHRGQPFDISADLAELGRTGVTVVSSGAKSILDLPATREVLETHGVPVLGYGVDEMPAFFARNSGLPVDLRVDSAPEVAQVVKVRRALRLETAILVTVPVPQEDACDADEVESAVAQANLEAEAMGIGGPAATPWLLGRVVELTGGRSLRANVSLLQNNSAVAAQIAVALGQREDV